MAEAGLGAAAEVGGGGVYSCQYEANWRGHGNLHAFEPHKVTAAVEHCPCQAHVEG